MRTHPLTKELQPGDELAHYIAHRWQSDFNNPLHVLAVDFLSTLRRRFILATGQSYLDALRDDPKLVLQWLRQKAQVV